MGVGDRPDPRLRRRCAQRALAADPGRHLRLRRPHAELDRRPGLRRRPARPGGHRRLRHRPRSLRRHHPPRREDRHGHGRRRPSTTAATPSTASSTRTSRARSPPSATWWPGRGGEASRPGRCRRSGFQGRVAGAESSTPRRPGFADRGVEDSAPATPAELGSHLAARSGVRDAAEGVSELSRRRPSKVRPASQPPAERTVENLPGATDPARPPFWNRAGVWPWPSWPCC